MTWSIKWLWATGKRKPAVCFGGKQRMVSAVSGYPVRVVISEYPGDFARTPSVQGDSPGKVSEVVQKFKEIAVRNGITDGAGRLLDLCLAGATQIDELSFIDEEDMEMRNEGKTSEGEPGIKDEQGEASAEPKSETKETEVSTKKKAKAKAKKAPKAKKDKGPSKISQAVEYMAAEIKKAGGQTKLERGFRKELFDKAAKKFGLSPITCSIQYNRQILNKGKKD